MGSIQVQDFTTTGLATSNEFNDIGDGLTWTVYDGSVARLYGTVYNANDLNAQLEVDFFFENGVSGETWTDIGNGVNDNSATQSDVDEWTIWRVEDGDEQAGGCRKFGRCGVVPVPNPMRKTATAFRQAQVPTDWTTVKVWGRFQLGYMHRRLSLRRQRFVFLLFSSCETENYTCASDNDAVVHFFVGSLTSFDQLEAYIDAVDDVPPVLHNLPNDIFQNCPVDLGALDADVKAFLQPTLAARLS